MPFLITISGLDGSGKSTQIEMLKKHLKSKGKSFWYFHAVDFSIGNKILISKKKKTESVAKANWLQIQLRKIALLIDICRFKRLIKQKKVDYIISDRYFFDSVVNINYLSEKNKYRLVECFIPHPNKAFYIKVAPEKIMQRERKPDQGLEYLAAKEKIYESRIEGWGMIVLDGEKEKEEIFNEIKSKIGE